MEDRLECKQRRVLVIDATAMDYADVTPAVGHAYKIISGYGWHDEGAPLDCVWALDDGAGGGFRNLCATFNLASAVYAQLYTGVPCQGPIVLRFGQTLRFNAASKTVAHNVVQELLIDEIVGETAYTM